MRSLVMRSSSAIAVALAVTLCAAPAMAAPTCQDQAGRGVRCGSAGAMPVGWTLSPSERWDRDMAQPDVTDPAIFVRLACLLGALFALFALLPSFDGAKDGDWDRQEDDEAR